MERKQSLAFGAALVTVVLWASAFVGIRSAGESLSPGALALARLAIGVAVLGVFVAIRRESFPSRRDLPLIGLCGVLWFAAYNIALNASERHLDARPRCSSTSVRSSSPSWRACCSGRDSRGS